MSLNKLKKVFLNCEGRLRAVWQLTAVVLGWFAVYAASAVGISRLILSLFARWGVTNANIAMCPAWVQYLAAYQAQLSMAAAGIVCLALVLPVLRVYPAKARMTVKAAVKNSVFFAAGVLLPVALMGIFMLTDSMRTTKVVQVFTADIIIVLAVSLITAASECAAAFGYVRRMAECHAGKAAAVMISAAVYCVIGLVSFSTALGVLNSLLIGIVLSIVCAKISLGPVIALRAGWLWSAAALAGFDGSGVLSLYPVSENIFTGGYYGPESGMAVTLICVCVIAVLMRTELKHVAELIKCRLAIKK